MACKPILARALAMISNAAIARMRVFYGLEADPFRVEFVQHFGDIGVAEDFCEVNGGGAWDVG